MTFGFINGCSKGDHVPGEIIGSLMDFKIDSNHRSYPNNKSYIRIKKNCQRCKCDYEDWKEISTDVRSLLCDMSDEIYNLKNPKKTEKEIDRNKK